MNQGKEQEKSQKEFQIQSDIRWKCLQEQKNCDDNKYLKFEQKIKFHDFFQSFIFHDISAWYRFVFICDIKWKIPFLY